MAANFRIQTRKGKNKKVFINLSGDFDGTSAWELINKLNQCSDRTPLIVVNTDKIKIIEPYGLGVLEKNVGAIKKHTRIIETAGEHPHSLQL